MRNSLVRRASACAVASCLAAVAAIGCETGGVVGGGGGPGTSGPGITGPGTTGPGTTGGETSHAPATPVSGCEVDSDLELGAGDSPAIAAGNGRFAIAWIDPAQGGDVMLTLADESGQSVHQERIAAGPAAAVSPTIAAIPGGFLVAWEELAGAGGTVRAVRVGADGRPQGGAITLATAGSAEAHPDAATTASGALVAWTEANGAVVGEIRDGALAGKMSLPGAAQAAVAGTRGGLAAVWSAGPSLGFARLPAALSTAGAAMNVVTFRAAAGRANIPRLAAGPDGSYAVVWEDTRGGPDNEAVYIATVGAGGQPSAEMQVSPPGGSANYPDVAFIGGRAAVTYYQWRDHPSAVYLTLIDPGHGRVGKDLQISDEEPARLPRIAAGAGGTLGVAYAQRGGSVRLAVVSCK
ncbi:MAG: hypothetical protein QM820_47330 [Minicystis sp.]